MRYEHALSLKWSNESLVNCQGRIWGRIAPGPPLGNGKNCTIFNVKKIYAELDWIEQGLTSPPTQYRLSGRQFYRSKDPTNSIKVLKEKLAYAEIRTLLKMYTLKCTPAPFIFLNTPLMTVHQSSPGDCLALSAMHTTSRKRPFKFWPRCTKLPACLCLHLPAVLSLKMQ